MEKDQYEIMRRIEDSFWWYVGMRRIVSALLPPLVPGGASWRILDAGCGTGATLDFLAPRGAVVGVDIAAEALSHCHERGHRLVSRGSIEQLPFPGASFDLVTCFDCLHVGREECAVLGRQRMGFSTPRTTISGYGGPIQ